MSTSASELGIKEPHLKGNYQIAISQDGKFVVTFDTINLRIKVLENTDHRSSFKDDFSSESENINKTIAHFKINNDFKICKFYHPETGIKNDGVSDSSSSSNNKVTTEDKDKFRWSIDISNLREQSDKIFVAVSCINVEEDMKGKEEDESGYKGLNKFTHTIRVEHLDKDTTIDMPGIEESKAKGTSIYCLKLEKEKITVKIFHSSKVSGICKFIDINGFEKYVEPERFVILNFRGIYNFEIDTEPEGIDFNLNEKFKYPKSIRRELNYWHSNDDCMRRLRSCIYDKYFLVTQYKNDVQSLEVYNLAKMKLETTAKTVENEDNLVRQCNYDTFSVFSLSGLLFCFTRGMNHVMLYYIENGLQITSRKLEGKKKIHLLEFIDSDKKILIICEDLKGKLNFIIWDLYNKDELDKCPAIKGIEDIDRLATTSGNILYVDDKGNVISIIKKIENELKEPNEKKSKLDGYAELVKNNSDDKHKIYCDKNTIQNFNEDNNIIATFKKIADGIGPWMTDDHERHSYCLYYNRQGTKTEFLQLMVGRSTVQIWHQISDDNYKMNDQLPNRGEPFLEYIWTNGIPVNQERNETRLRIEDFKYGLNESNDKLNNFSLKVYWYVRKSIRKDGGDEETKENKEIDKMEEGTIQTGIYMRKKTRKIKWKKIIETFHPIRHACKALKHLNKRCVTKCLADNYKRVHKHEEIVSYIERIVWRFAKYNPEKFKLLDIRYNFMKSLILGDCGRLIKFILFGEEGNTEKDKRHIPRNELWQGKTFIKDDDLDFNMKHMKDDKHRKKNVLEDNDGIKPKNDMELAIYHCRDAIIVAYLLEYYSENAKDYAGWMCTVSKALPLLFKYNYDDYIGKFFRKECFINQNHFLEQSLNEIITEQHLGRLNNVIKFRVTKQPTDKLKSDKDDKDSWQDRYMESIHKIYEFFLGKSYKKPPLALRVVPLPGFTMNNIPKKREKYDFILNILWFIFIPKWYEIKPSDKHDLSPLSRMILYENNDDIYDNPAIEAVIDFRWQKAKKFFITSLIRILIFAFCFGLVSWEYLVHEVISDGYRNFLVALIAIFYYLAFYLLVNEVIQICYHKLRRYLDLFNIFDICSIILPVIVMSIMIKEFQFFSDGFGNVETVNTGLMVGISVSIFLFWIEMIFYLRFMSGTAIYLYYSITIFETILPFFLFMLIMIIAFAHSMFILLRDPVNIGTKDQTLSGSATNTLTNETLDIKLKSDFDTKSRVDNPFSSFFFDAIEASYFWINGNWVQKDDFDFWAVDLYTVIASIVLVIFIQNLLIAYMGGMHEKANIKGRQILLRHRARYMADCEALHHTHFWQDESEPKYIYYFGYLKHFEDWLNVQNTIYESFEEKSTSTRYAFKDYDNFSSLEYDNNNNVTKIEKIKNMKNDGSVDFKYLIGEFKNQESDNYKEIEKIKEIIDVKIDHLIENLTIGEN